MVSRTRRVISLLAVIFVVAAGGIGLSSSQAAVAATYSPPTVRQQADLDSGWRFIRSDVSGAQASGFDDSSWSTVNVPHTWNATDGSDGGDNYYRGVGWYRRHYTVPAADAGKMLYLQFAGVNQVADVWVNGVHLGQHVGGCAQFRYGATSALKVGQDNVIAVKVTNANNNDVAPLSADYTFDGGIYRDVSLQVVDPLQVRMLDNAGPGVYLRQQAVSAASATVVVTTKLFNNYTTARSVVVRTVITDKTGGIVVDQSLPARTVAANAEADVTQTITIANPHLWNGTADPYLYQANVELHDQTAGRITDEVTQPLGLRFYSLDPNKGFSLNGHALKLHGVDLHQDQAGVGWAATQAQHVKDLGLITQMGANSIRMAHYQHAQAEYDLADQDGLIIWSEIPLVNNVTDSAAFTANAKQQLTELITQNYNHPSIVFWGIGNEQREDDTATNTLLSTLAGMVKSLDPGRISTYANCCVSDTSAVDSHTTANGYNKYYGWYGGSYNDLGAAMDALHKAAPTKDLAISEYGAGANTTQHALNPAEPDAGGQYHPEEYQDLLHEASWKQIAVRPYIWGSYVWNMFDFASDGRNEGDQPGINDKGLVTRDRKTLKDSYFFYKANWATTPTLYITSRRWTARTTAATQLKVYSNATSVSATLNGVSLGSKTGSYGIFTWTSVTLTKGANVIKVTATINGTPETDTVTWNLS